MKSWLLDKILDECIEKYNFNHQKIVFVLPSKRSIYYSKHHLKQIFQQRKTSGFLPEFVTPAELAEKITGLTVLTNIELIYYLYCSYQKIYKHQEEYKNDNKHKSENYSSFIKWASMLLSDFNDILISHPNDLNKQKDIFTNLKNIREIEHWSLNKEPLSENQEKYLKLMHAFYDIFNDFNTTLLSNNYAYTGLNYQKSAEIIQTNEAKNNIYLNNTEQFIFVGLNAITPAEEIIYKHLKNDGKALFYWDYDDYYTKNTTDEWNHEAGKFLKENFKKYGLETSNKYSTSFFDKEKKIYIATGTNDTEEVLYIIKILQKIQDEEKDLSQTAIVLNKPEALTLILSAIPDEVQYNVSMEYPLYLTPAYQLLNDILKIFAHQLKTNEKTNLIYYKHFLSILFNSFFKDYMYCACQTEEKTIQQLIHNIQKKNKIFISITNDSIFKEIINEKESVNQQLEKIKSFFQIFKEQEVTKIIQHINQLFQEYLIIKLKKESKDIFNINTIHTICEQLNKIENILRKDKGTILKDIRDVQALVQQILMKEAIPFKGEPLSGLQIIGTLESRLLDFENILIPFMNENVFPPDHRKTSFIPYDLSNYHQLPTHYNQDAIFSYLFYRNLHQPKSIYLSYINPENAEDKGLQNNTGEKSRYIQQIEYELSQKKNIKIEKYNIVSQQKIITPNIIEIPKNNQLINTLKNIVYSPSAITTYLDCSLKFYFRYILKLKSEDEPREELEADIEGNIFHEVMRILYSNQTEKILSKDGYIQTEKLNTLLNKETIIEKIIQKEIKNLNLERRGKTLIQEELLKKDILQLIKKEYEYTKDKKIKIIYIEKKEKIHPNNFILLDDTKISSIPDRIDYIENEKLYRIVDYKSSFREENDKMQFNDIEKCIDTKIKSIYKQLQLLIYIHYAIQSQIINLKKQEKIKGAILPLRTKSLKNHEKSDSPYFYTDEFTSDNTNPTYHLNNIENKIKYFFNKYIMNKKHHFQQTKDETTCKYCDFNYICKKVESED